MKNIAIGIVVALLAIFGVWAHFAGPCWMFKYDKAGDVPARCLMK